MIHPVPKGEKERTRTALSSRKDDGIHDMYDAVGCRDIGNDDLCVVDVDIAHIDFDNNRITRKGFNGFAVQRQNRFRIYLTGNNVVKKDVGESRDVVQKGINGSFGQFGEGIIGGCEDRELSVVRQGLHQVLRHPERRRES
jgi:hypothetical protein